MDKEKNPPTPTAHTEEEEHVQPVVRLLLKLEQELETSVQTPCDTVAIADAAEEILCSMLGLKGGEAEQRKQ